MARPRVFISSTFYDLKQVRSVLDGFVRDLGFEVVLNEQGTVPYSASESPEQGAYREVDLCNILVAIIGGRVGTPSDDGVYSITQREIKRAHEKGKQIYIFIERSVYASYEFYLINRNTPAVEYVSGSPAVFKFIEEVKSLPQNNAIAPFELAADITSYLREQWAGLFHRLLEEAARGKSIEAEIDFRSASETLKQLITYLTEERKSSSETIRDILLSNHPAFTALQKQLRIKHRVIFRTVDELKALMEAYGYELQYNPFADDGDTDSEWVRDTPTERSTLEIASGVFDTEGKLVPRGPEDWDQNLIKRTLNKKATTPQDEYDPFADD